MAFVYTHTHMPTHAYVGTRLSRVRIVSRLIVDAHVCAVKAHVCTTL